MPASPDPVARRGDPFGDLGLGADAGADDVRAARRRLAKMLHPDRLAGADEAERRAATDRLAAVNRSADLALEQVAARDAPTDASRPPGPARRPAAAGDNVEGRVRSSQQGEGQRAARQGDSGRDEDQTVVSFSVDVLPVEAFELLFLALSSIGDPKMLDEPYRMEGVVDDPSLGLCRIDLVPDAGGSVVTVQVWPMARAPDPPPPALAVAGRLLAEMQAFGRP